MHAAIEPTASTAFMTRAEALERARALVPQLRERAALADELRRCPDENIEALHASGLLRVMQPSRVGGAELDITILIDIGAELARGCASTAWVWGNLAAHHWMLALWPPQAQDEIWSESRDALIASSMVFPAGKARRATGGYRLTGRWPFSSGVDPCGWNMLAGTVTSEAPDRAPEMRLFLLPKSDYRVIDNWHVMGLRGTGSKDVEAKDVFVPEHRTVWIDTIKGGPTHPGHKVNPAPVFSISVFATFPYMLTGIALGIAEGAYESYVGQMRDRVAQYSGKSLADMTAVQIKIADAAACIDTARMIMRAHCDDAQRHAEQNKVPDLLTKARWRRDGAFSAQLCVRAVDGLFSLAGGGGLYDSHPIQRAFRDVHAAAQHISMIWEAQATTFGRVALGLPCDNPTL